MSERIDDSGGGPDELERALSRLKPRTSGVAHEHVMFLAGRRDAQREMRDKRSRIWPMATAASWLVTAAMAGLWWHASGEPVRRDLAHNAPTDVNIVAADPSHGESRADASTESVTRSAAAAADHLTTNRRPTPAAASGSVSPFAFHVSGEPLGELPRLSIVGWQDWERQDRGDGRADEILAADAPPAAPPATYARLMKLYLDDRSGSEIEGDLL